MLPSSLPCFPYTERFADPSSNVDKVDQTMDSIREQMDLTNEISDAISNPVGMGNQVDEVRYAPVTSRRESAHKLYRTSSRRSSKRSNRRNWTTDWLGPNVHRSTHPLRQSACLQVVSVSPAVHPARTVLMYPQAWRRSKRKTTRRLNCDNCRPSWPCKVRCAQHI